jgi:hypothetical protein
MFGLIFQRIIELFTQISVNKLAKIWVWNPGSEIRKKPIPDPGSRGKKKALDPGSESATLFVDLLEETRIRIYNTTHKQLSTSSVADL